RLAFAKSGTEPGAGPLRTGNGVQAISGAFLPPSPPAEKTTARQDQTSRLQCVHAACADSFAPARFATKGGFARTFGVTSIRANNIRAIAIMTKAVETSRIWALR